jgi:Protein of unknown function (DUF1524)
MGEAKNTEAVEAFIRRWQGREGGQERANYVSFLNELIALLGLPPLDPADATHEHNDYVFERAVRKHRDEGDSQGRIDLYRKNSFVLEAKQSRLKGVKKVAGQNDLFTTDILPDNWLAEWPMLGNQQPNADEYSASLYGLQEDDTLLGQMVRRHRLKHLGNLTLVTQSFNSMVSNCAFDTKRPEFRERSVLMLNKDVAKEKIWNEPKIEERGSRLSKEALAIWPAPATTAVGTNDGGDVLRRRI